MASAPPMETGGFPQPPSYEEAMHNSYPQYPQGPVPFPPGYTKPMEPPYPTQVPSPPGAGPLVSVQTIYVQPGVVYRDQPVQVHCPVCMQFVMTQLEYNLGTMTWLTCAGLFVFGCVYGCCLIPFCVNGMKDVTHRCPNCNNSLGVYKRL